MELGSWLKLLEGGGPALPALILGALYWYERKEHRECRAARDALLERTLAALTENSTVLKQWTKMLGG